MGAAPPKQAIECFLQREPSRENEQINADTAKMAIRAGMGPPITKCKEPCAIPVHVACPTPSDRAI